jgi:hypothetical protein
MEIIVPAAGLSTRFPGMRPKYTLTDHSGFMMIERAIAPYINRHHITIGFLAEHHDQYPINQYLLDKYGQHNVEIVIIPQRTQGPADTVMQIIDQARIHEGSILIKDCDSFFDHDELDGNYICTTDLTDHYILKRLSSKSFVKYHDTWVTGIVEKSIVSDRFCVGGYHFANVQDFKHAYHSLDKAGYQEIFVSNIIQYCIEQGSDWTTTKVSNYVDVGTAEDWHEHNDLSVIFCDIDGTIIKAQARGEFGDPMQPLVSNCKLIQDLVDKGHQLIFTTARPQEQQAKLRQQLQDLGFQDFQLITGLKNVKRILINDYNHANPYPRAIAINIHRDSDTLGDFL